MIYQCSHCGRMTDNTEGAQCHCRICWAKRNKPGGPAVETITLGEIESAIYDRPKKRAK
jgi:hypothetical protein